MTILYIIYSWHYVHILYIYRYMTFDLFYMSGSLVIPPVDHLNTNKTILYYEFWNCENKWCQVRNCQWLEWLCYWYACRKWLHNKHDMHNFMFCWQWISIYSFTEKPTRCAIYLQYTLSNTSTCFGRIYSSSSGGRVQLKCDGTRWRTVEEVKGKHANAVGNQYSSHYLATWFIQHYYRWCAHLGCQ